MKIGQQANPQPVNDVAASLEETVTQQCTTVQNLEQQTVCSLTAAQCPDLSVACENIGSQVVRCSIESAGNAAVTALQNESTAGLAVALKLPTDTPREVVNNNIKALVNESCYASQNANQSASVELACMAASRVSLTVLSSVSQQVACSLGATLKLAEESRQYEADQFNQSQANTALIGVLVGSGLLLIAVLGIMFGVGYS
jgi:hypothetical protein